MRTLEDEMISLVHEAFSNYWTRYNQAIREWEPILESNTERLNAQQSLAIHSESNSSDEHKTDSPSGILFADYLTVWLEDRRCKLEETTYGGYQQDIVQISPYFRERTLYIEQITDKVITNFYRYKRKNGVSENTLLHYQTIMNQTLHKAVKEKLISLNPYAVLDKDIKPKRVRYAPEIYNAEDLKQLFTVMQGDPLALLILMDVTYGLHRSELLGLKWSAIDLENKNIHIGYKVTEAVIDGKLKPVMSNVMKTKSSNRTLPLVPMIEQKLLQHRQEQQWNQKMYRKAYNPGYTDFVFVNDRGDLLKPDYVSKHFRLLLRKNKLKKIRWHDLRHICATILCRQKISLRDIQLWLGHSTYQTTADIDTHLDYRDKLSTADAAAGVVMDIMHSGA